MTTVHRAPIAVRAYVPGDRPRRERKRARPEPDIVLVLDFETTVDRIQALLFGSFRVYKAGRLVREGLVYAEDLPKHDLALLRQYVANHSDDGGGPLRLMSRAEFVEEVLWRIGYVARAAIVGLNLGFDLSRASVASTRARNGGFSLQLFESIDSAGRKWIHQWRPNITVKHLGSKRQFISFTTPARLDPENRVDGKGYRGRFIDLRMAAFALTDRSHSLASAAMEFGLAEAKGDPGQHGVITPDYVDYNRQDVRTSWALFHAIRSEWSRHGLDRPLEELYSGASVGKAYLAAMGITPPMTKAVAVSNEIIGHHTSAYFGGRAAANIRRWPMPVRYVDLVSQYPTVFALLDLWHYMTAGELVAVDATDAAREWLDGITRERLHDPAPWLALACTACRIRPSGHLLPVRSRYSACEEGAWTIGLNELTTDRDIWLTLADLAACKILTGRTPDILEASRIEARGRQRGLRKARLRGEIEVDPAYENFFRVVIEARQRIKRDLTRPEAERKRLDRFTKVVCNSTSYGLEAEVRVTEPVKGARVTAYGLDTLHATVPALEEPGPYSFPPLAATITGAGRLLLALIEADVSQLGGSYVGVDTDAMLIVASRGGGLVACPGGPHRLPDGCQAVLALSDTQIDGIRRDVNRLNPYAPDAVPDLLKLEDENFAPEGSGRRVELLAMQISAKRYSCYERNGDEIVLRKVSEHGLGLFRPPVPRDQENWYETVWDRLVREVEEMPVPPVPGWFNQPAVSQLAISTPALLAPFRSLNGAKPYRDQVKPHNFMLIGHDDPLAPLPEGITTTQLTPVAPFTSDPTEYMTQPWVNRHDGRPLTVTTKPAGESGKVRLKTYCDIVDDYRTHPESKSGDPRGGRATRGSVGLLPRLHVAAIEIRHIGKESNRLDEVEEGLVADPDEVYVEYRDEKWEWKQALPGLRHLREEIGAWDLARRAAMSERALRYALNGGKLPRAGARQRLIACLG